MSVLYRRMELFKVPVVMAPLICHTSKIPVLPFANWGGDRFALTII